MPFYSTSEMAQTYQIPSEVVYCLAGKLPGFFPDLKAKVSDTRSAYRSFYSEYKVHLLGETLRKAPGDTIDQKIESIYKGFQLTKKDKEMILQNLSPQQTTSLMNQVKQIWEFCCGTLGSQRDSVANLQEAASSRIRACKRHYEDVTTYRDNAYKIIKAHVDYLYDRGNQEEILRKADLINTVAASDVSLAERLQKDRKLWLDVRDLLVKAHIISSAGPSGWYKISRNYNKESACNSPQNLQSAS